MNHRMHTTNTLRIILYYFYILFDKTQASILKALEEKFIQYSKAKGNIIVTIDFFCDLHMHSNYSDGKGTMEDMAKSAIEKGLTTIAITDHMPLPLNQWYSVGTDKIQSYRDEIHKVQTLYGHKLNILSGLEIEYIPQILDWVASIVDLGWDYTIASVHCFLVDNFPYLINGNEKEFNKTLNIAFKGDIRVFCTQYYHFVQQAAGTGWCNSVGHLDVIKKYNCSNKYFDEQSLWYQELIYETLDVIKACNIKMEINTAGFIHPIGEVYPSPWIIKEAIKRGIPIVMGSDSHSPKTLGQYFEQARDLVR